MCLQVQSPWAQECIMLEMLARTLRARFKRQLRARRHDITDEVVAFANLAFGSSTYVLSRVARLVSHALTLGRAPTVRRASKEFWKTMATRLETKFDAPQLWTRLPVTQHIVGTSVSSSWAPCMCLIHACASRCRCPWVRCFVGFVTWHGLTSAMTPRVDCWRRLHCLIATSRLVTRAYH